MFSDYNWFYKLGEVFSEAALGILLNLVVSSMKLVSCLQLLITKEARSLNYLNYQVTNKWRRQKRRETEVGDAGAAGPELQKFANTT